MKTVTWVVLLACASAAAGEPQRARSARAGWLTGAGLMLAGAGAVALSLGAYDTAQAEAAAHTVRAYYANGAAPTAAEASTVRWLHERTQQLGALGLGLLVSGGAAVVLGISMVLLDGLGDASVSLSIQPARAMMLVSGTF